MFLASASFVLLISISHVSGHPKPHIAEAGGGKPTAPHQYPWIVRLDAVDDDISINPVNNKVESYTGRLCGATLIPAYGRTQDSDIVITAAHCMLKAEARTTANGKLEMEKTLEPISPSKRRLVAGVHSIRSLTEPGSQVRQISRFKNHPDFKNQHNHDIAIIQLDKPIKFSDTIKSIALPSKGDRPTDSCVIAGWGDINTTNTPEVLYHMNVTVEGDCRLSPETGHCVVSSSDKFLPTACGGDSGSPLFCKRKDEWVQYGALSYGKGNCEKDMFGTIPSVYMSTEVYLDWINEKVREWSVVADEEK